MHFIQFFFLLYVECETVADQRCNTHFVVIQDCTTALFRTVGRRLSCNYGQHVYCRAQLAVILNQNGFFSRIW